MRVTVLIPVYNEIDTIREVVARVEATSEAKVFRRSALKGITLRARL